MAGCLDGIKVLDLGRYQAGPRCAMILADLGAEVIKVEEPGGDESRGLGRVYWSAYNRGKKSITLNLRSTQGKALARSHGRNGLRLWDTQATQSGHHPYQCVWLRPRRTVQTSSGLRPDRPGHVGTDEFYWFPR